MGKFSWLAWIMQFLLGGAVGVAIALKFTKGWWKYTSASTTLLIGAALIAGGAAALLGDQLWMGRSVVNDRLPKHTRLSKQLATSLIVLGVSCMLVAFWMLGRG